MEFLKNLLSFLNSFLNEMIRFKKAAKSCDHSGVPNPLPKLAKQRCSESCHPYITPWHWLREVGPPRGFSDGKA